MPLDQFKIGGSSKARRERVLRAKAEAMTDTGLYRLIRRQEEDYAPTLSEIDESVQTGHEDDLHSALVNRYVMNQLEEEGYD